PGDLVRYDVGGVYIWRRGDTTLEKPNGDKYLVKNPGILSVSQMGDIAQDTAHLLALICELPVFTVLGPEDRTAYQIGEQK
ncbi:MAG: hypothetical protein UY00_C0005G0001, partial [Candidatus Wolfebacteria bacterium GW2011_GWA1_47_6]